MFIDLKNFNDKSWKEILSLVNNAAVYIDHAAAECLHWHSGDKAYLTLKNSGAISVHELALYNFKYVIAKAEKAVIISTSTDSIFYQRTLQLIIEKNNFTECTIVCATHKKVLNYTSIAPADFKNSSYETLKGDVLHWMSRRDNLKEMKVIMLFKPIFISQIKDNIFVTPPFGDLMPNINKNLTEDIEDDIEFLISSFHSLFSYYNVQEEIYSIGNLSNYIAEKYGNFPAAVNRKQNVANDRKVSLILVDRLLDLSTATSFNTESMFGRILCTMSRLPHHYNDVAIPMDSLCIQGEKCQSTLMVPGCLANNDEELMSILFNKKQKDILLTLNNMLINMSSDKRNTQTSKISTRISAHSLEKGIQKFKDSESIENLYKHSKTLQLIAAVVQSLKSNKTAQIEFILSLEKLILQNLAVSRDSSSILSQLGHIIKTRATRDLEMEYLLVLLIHLYAVAGVDIKFSEHQEQELKNMISNAIYEDIKKCNENDLNNELSAYYQTLLLLGFTDENSAKEASEKITNKIMNLLHQISQQRKFLKNYSSVIRKPNPQEMARHIGLLEQLLTDLMDEQKSQLTDLTSQKSFLSASLSLLTKGTIEHPRNNSCILIYVIGGITSDEVRIVEDIINKKNNIPQIILGGTRLINPLDVVDKILLSNINTL